MKQPKEYLRLTLIKAALGADTPSKQKSRIMKLWEHGLITSCDARSIIAREGLKHD